MSSTLTPVAFDIETTGFDADAVVTTIGFALPLGCRLLVGTDGRSLDVDRLESRLADRFDTDLQLSSHATERDLLDATATFVADSLAPKEYLLVAYNGDRYTGGFDLPFLRTRCATHDRSWLFSNLPYTDLLDVYQARFNTTQGEESPADLETVYETLVGGRLTRLDPFEDSREAVTAYREGDFEALLAHNLADVRRTDALATLAERYCSKSDFKLKRLTPAIVDQHQ